MNESTITHDRVLRSNLKLKHLQLLVALDQFRHLGRASEYLSLTQPAVSKTLAEVERLFGLPLFLRSTRGTEPTAHGLSVVRFARSVLADFERTRDELAAVGSGAAGRVRVGAMVVATPGLLMRAIDALMNEHPQLLVLVSAGNVPPFLQSAGGVLEAGAVSGLGWRVQPDDPTDNHLELLVYGSGALPAEAESALDITLHGPGAGGSHRLAGSGQLRIGDHEQLLGLLSCEPAQALSDTERARLRSRLGEPLRWRQRLLLSLAAAQPGRLQPAGAWTLALRVAKQRVQLLAQVQGDASPWPGRVAQSALQAEALGPGLRPEATRNVLASGEGPWVVTASRLSDGRPSPYSPPHDRTRAVALRAAADEGQFVLGLHAAGVLSGSLVRMNGTSVASAVAARVWVNLAVRLPPGLKDWRRAFVEAARHAKRGPGDDLDLSLRPGDVAGQAPWLQSR